MNDDSVDKRLDRLEKDLNRIKGLYEKTLSYEATDPIVSLLKARMSTEAICKQVFKEEGLDKKGEKPISKLMLKELVDKLNRADILPEHILISLNTIQKFGNFGSHDQGDDSENITQKFIQPCLQALATLVDWYFLEYHGKDIQMGMPSNHVENINLSSRELRKVFERRVRRSIALNAFGRAKSKILDAEITSNEENKDEEVFRFKGTFTGENPLRFFFNYPFNYTGRFEGEAINSTPYNIERLRFSSFWERIRGVQWVSVRDQFVRRSNIELPATLEVAQGSPACTDDEIN